MSNILTFTEQFDNAAWTKASMTITADSQAAPAFAGGLAGLADTLEDADGAVASNIFQDKAKGVSDATSWTASVFVRKVASAPATVPEFRIQFRNGGTFIQRGIRFNPLASAPAIGASGEGATDASGWVDEDENWWRVWWRHADNNSGNLDIRLVILPAIAETIGGASNSTLTGSIICWGANITHSSSLLAYVPDPFYVIPGPGGWITLDTLGSTASSYSDQDVLLEGGVEYDYRILAENTAGQTPSNIVTAAPNAASGGAGNLIVQARRLWTGMYRAIGRGVN